MSAEIIDLAARRYPRNTGNGARENVARYFEAVGLGGELKGGMALPFVDHFLACMWMEGFKIVPLEPSDLA